MDQETVTDLMSPRLRKGNNRLTVHRKITSVMPEFRVVSSVVVKTILSVSDPTNTTLTSSTGRTCTKAISQIAADHSKKPTDGRLL